MVVIIYIIIYNNIYNALQIAIASREYRKINALAVSGVIVIVIVSEVPPATYT